MLVYDASFPHCSEDRDEVAAEASAILAVGKALSGLRDPEARLRVLRWANERFNASAALDPAPATAAIPAGPTDSTLSVEGLHALFEPSPRRKEADALRRHEANDAPHEIALEDEDSGDLFEGRVLRGRAELRVVARNDAPAKKAVDEVHDLYEEMTAHQAEAGEPLGDLFDTPVTEGRADADDRIAAAHAEPLEAAPAEVQAVAREDQPLDTLVSDFASAIRALTLQFEDATS